VMFLPIIRSIWLYLQLLILSTGQQQHRWTTSGAVNTVKCSWWWAKTSPETCRDNWVQIHKPKSCILLVINYELYQEVGTCGRLKNLCLKRKPIICPHIRYSQNPCRRITISMNMFPLFINL
jgi:hypothetical protein